MLLLVDMNILCCKIHLNPNFKRQKTKDFKAEVLFKAGLLCLSKCPSYPILLNNMLVITIPLFFSFISLKHKSLLFYYYRGKFGSFIIFCHHPPKNVI